jgi:hypothetical protein
VIFSLGGAVYETRLARANESALDVTRREADQQRLQVQALAARVRTSDQDLAQLQQSIDETLAATKAAETARAAVRPVAGPGADQAAMLDAGNAFLAANPAVKKALVDRSRARVASRFYPLYAKLKLTPEQIERFETLQIEYEGISNSGPQGAMMLRPGVGLARDQVEQGVRDLLGEENYKEYLLAGRMGGAMQYSTALAASLYFTDTPLTAAQADQLGRVILDIGPGQGRPGTNWDLLFQRARNFLSEPQVAAMARLRAQEEFGITMKELIGK